MKNIVTLILMMIWVQGLITAQIPVKSEKIVTDFVNGEKIIVSENVSSGIIRNHVQFANTDLETGLIWQADAEWAVCKSVGISDVTYHSFIGWYYNSPRVAYFGETNIPEWEYSLGTSDYVFHDINSEGDFLICSVDNLIHQLDTVTGNPVWTYTNDEDVYNVKISEDKETLYFVSDAINSIMNITSLDVETSTENWSFTLPEDQHVWGLEVSGNGEKIVIQQKHWLTACNSIGEILLQTEDHPNSQSLPSISYDGNKFVVGDQKGYVRLYTYLESPNIYAQTWFWQYPYSGTFNWATAVAISSDGSSIVSGSLNFEGGGIYGGTVAFFEASSGTPVWTNTVGDDEISCIDISTDGTVIAAASWGPIDDSGSDFWIFNNDSNQPVFEYECTGSPKALDLSADGIKCIVGGKAMHSRITGHGGKLYYFDISQPPSVSGTVTDVITNDPLEDAVITLGTSYTDTTNSSGFYNIEDVVAGTYTLTCELTGYETFTTEIDVEGNETINIELQILSGIDNPFALQNNVSVTNYPNPFNSVTTISYSIPKNNIVSIGIYDIQGKKIKTLVNEYQEFGNHSVVWNGNDYNGKVVSSGIYYCCLRAGNSLITKKMIITQ